MHQASAVPGTITLVGSGEMSPSMAKVHRAVMSRILEPVRAVFLDTPAGFELNADQIALKAVEYFRQRLNQHLAVASFQSAAAATEEEVAIALGKLRQANFIFAGPGSPTYAIRNWRGTRVWEGIRRRLDEGAHVLCASAAAIALGRHALPVYEIYKVGQDPHWVDGLDLFARYGLELAVVPHWNNAEGGTYDTRYCFMGAPRMRRLEERLPDTTTILGIDEYTACILDLGGGRCEVLGAGGVTIRHAGSEASHETGSTFDLCELKGALLAEGRDYPLQAGAVRFEWPEPEEQNTVDVAPFVDLLVQVRSELRAAEEWHLADQIRERLSDLDIILEDKPDGTTWRQA